MATKKAASHRRQAAHPRPRSTVAAPSAPAEVFSTEMAHPARVEVPRGSVRLFVNGRDHGNKETDQQTLGTFVTSQAEAAGIRSFSVYCDGQKMTTADAGKRLAGVTKVEIVAKDARG